MSVCMAILRAPSVVPCRHAAQLSDGTAIGLGHPSIQWSRDGQQRPMGGIIFQAQTFEEYGQDTTRRNSWGSH